MEKALALFDFDGTVYKKDSLVECCKFIYKKEPWRIIFVLLQLIGLLLHSLRLISAQQFKDLFLCYTYFLPPPKMNNYLKAFWSQEQKNLNTEVLQLLDEQRKLGHYIVCVSASPKFQFTELNRLLTFDKVIATNTEYTNRFQLMGKNCRGKEKLEQVQSTFGPHAKIAFAISDNQDDHFILAAAETAYEIKKDKPQKTN